MNRQPTQPASSRLNPRIFSRWMAGLAAGLALTASAQTVEKVADLSFASIDGVGFGGYDPLGRLTQVGTNLWFTTDKGGTFDAGTISRFDLVTREVVEVASFDNITGKGSESHLLTIGNEGYFTTKSGGTGNAGTLAKVDYTSGAVTVLHHFPENSAANRTNGLQTGATPRGSLTRIGDELWTTTSLGGTSNRGTILRYHLTNGLASLVTNLDGPQIGGQAFAGFTPAGSNAWYFTTFTGGATFGQSGLPLGAGTLGRLTFDSLGQPVITRLVSLPAGYEQFPGSEPTFVGTNSLYFGTTGPNSAPGAIIRYDLASGTWANLFSFSTNAANALAYGTRPGYSAFVEWQGELYFLTRQGGVSNLGVVAKFNLASNTFTKLADFEGTAGAALGRATGIFDNAGLLVEEGGRFYIYYTVTSGGANNRGTIIRVNLPAPPIHLALAPAAPGELALSWTGGYAPFTVQARTNLAAGDWENLLENVTSRDTSIATTNRHAFFRVVGTP